MDGADRRLRHRPLRRLPRRRVWPAPRASTTFTDTPAPAEGTYIYTVAAVDNAGNSGLPSAGRTIVVDAHAAAGAGQPRRRRRPTSTKPVADLDVGRHRHRLRLRALQRLPQRRARRHRDRHDVHRHRRSRSTARSATRCGRSTSPATSRPRRPGVDGGLRQRGAARAVGPHRPAVVTTSPAPATGSAAARTAWPASTTTTSTAAASWSGSAGSATLRRRGHRRRRQLRYTVKAVDAAGNASAASNARTVLRDSTAPSVPQITRRARRRSARSRRMTWAASTDGSRLGRRRATTSTATAA